MRARARAISQPAVHHSVACIVVRKSSTLVCAKRQKLALSRTAYGMRWLVNYYLHIIEVGKESAEEESGGGRS